jgi:hypothetical protein
MGLTVEQQKAISAEFGRDLSRHWEPIAVSKPQIAEAIVAIDAWLDLNLAGYDGAISEAAKAGLTDKQKLQILQAIITARLEAI